MRLRKHKRCFPLCSSLHKVNSIVFSCLSMKDADNVDKDDIYWRCRKKNEELEWLRNSTLLISQLAKCFTNAMVGSGSWIGGLFSRTNTRRLSISEKFVDYPLSPVEEKSLQRLQERLQVPYDETHPNHQEALIALWHCSFPNVSLSGLISDQWKDMGWQGPNPSTDFRGCGFISLENLLFFARTYPATFHRLMLKKDGRRATYEYPFAVAGINISFMLIQMLDLCSGKPRCIPGMNFVKLLGENEEAFNILYCIAFKMMDAQWLAMNASYMNFNEVLHATRMKLERELSFGDINTIEYLPAYNLLYK
ncbi:PREDICTED: ELMO domain-containing protein A isoform X1 [Lupinus angustifolius]|uniref:ELMO domain-containing protein A isoform X1 n=2 Tax=Lupinus angustifolius TaxID=3871 RepID=UPI00092EC108|nr:PREDICTED: ELMO domain-containing protein A isoform X1 [Lupinus angustifolius]XP_019453718.1 PREDICTED: ELMO domain-containing protein A isoform X1 [Lupinus angustifolius]